MNRMKRFVAALLAVVMILSVMNPASVSAATPEKFTIKLKDTTFKKIDAGTKEIKYPDNTVVADGKTLTEVEVKGRGNSTWRYVKKPYQIKLKKAENLYGLGETKTWILLANYLDVANLRNDSALYMAGKLGLGFENKGTWVRLYDKDKEKGLYYLCHKNKIGKNELDLKSDTAIIVEMDEEKNVEQDEVYELSKVYKKAIMVKDTPGDEKEVLSRFMKSYNQLEQYAVARDYNKIKKLIDVDSFARYYLLQEFTKNIDGWHKSVYMYQDGPDDVIHAGPAWDYDNAFGSDEHPWVHKMYGNDVLSNNNSTANWATSTVYKELIAIPEFRQLVSDIYKKDFAPEVSGLTARIKSNWLLIRDYAKADVKLYSRKYTAKIQKDKMLDWIAARKKYMDIFYLPEASVKDGAYDIGGKVYDLKKDPKGGYTNYILTSDGKTYYLFDKALGKKLAQATKLVPHTHKLKKTVTKATTKKNGTIVETCSICKNKYKTKIVAAKKATAVKRIYDGKSAAPKVTVVDKSGKTIDAKFYTVSAAKAIGPHTATIKLKGNYKGTLKAKYTIVPSSVNMAAITDNTLEATKSSVKVSGYQFQVSEKADMTNPKAFNSSKNVLKKTLTANQKYVRVRCYKTIKKKKYYSNWSSVMAK
ncbi:MAG: CotH kinase family protein [Lachnospiraceae bacterium]|nr:CotH kinase family protein [Lachnospiraceae bacterium]